MILVHHLDEICIDVVGNPRPGKCRPRDIAIAVHKSIFHRHQLRSFGWRRWESDGSAGSGHHFGRTGQNVANFNFSSGERPHQQLDLAKALGCIASGVLWILRRCDCLLDRHTIQTDDFRAKGKP